jgi:nitrogen fixation negative regulator NifL
MKKENGAHPEGRPSQDAVSDESMQPPQGLTPGLFTETVRQAPIAISITDERANIVYVNKAFTEITGYAPCDCIGRNESLLSDKKTPRKVYDELWGKLQEQIPWRGRLLNRHRDGHAYLAELTVAPILNSKGETTHYIGMHSDVTEVYQLQQQVVDQKLLIETVVDSMPIATILLDEAGRIVLDNHAYKKLDSDLGLREPSRMFLEILKEEIGEDWERLRAKRLEFRNREIRYDRGGRHEPRWFTCSGTWFNGADGSVDTFFRAQAHTYLLLTLDEITHQKKHEAEIRINALRALMAEEENIQSLRETLLGAMHHIRGPINLLNAAKALLQRRGQERQNPALLEILEQILAAGEESLERLKRCIPETEDVTVGPVNINQLLHENILLLTERLLASGVVIDWKPMPILPTVMGLENRLRAMFKQILENAIDAMNLNGVRKRELRISTCSDKELIHICIEDTGPGIPEHLRVRAFEPFFSTKNGGANRHSGLGLTMAQEVINQHSGLIHFDPGYREGCRVMIQLQTHAVQDLTHSAYAHG